MMLWRLISWPYVRRHAVRSALTVAGIVLGVAVFFGMHTANQSVLYAFHRTVDRIAGSTELQVTAAESGFPEAVLEQVQALPEVRVAVPVIEAPVDTRLKGEGNLLILAVDMTGDRSLRDYDIESGEEAVVDDPLVFLAQPDSLIVTAEFASRNNLSIGSRVPMLTMEGERAFVVRGIMRSGGLTNAFGGNLAIMDIYAAQSVFGRGRRFDRLDVALTSGVTIPQGQAAIAKALGPGFQVDPPSARGRQIDAILRVYSISMNITSMFALFIGMFIIYNAFAIAVTQRRSEIGILRALGASRGQIVALFLGESVLAGAIGSLLGLLFGIGLSRAMAGTISGLISGIYGVGERVQEVAADPALMLGAVSMGVLTSVVAAFVPARNAARVDPVQALQKGKYQVLSAGENRVRRVTAGVLALASLSAVFFGGSRVVFYAGYLLAIVAVLLLTPTLSLWLTRWLRPLFRSLRPVEGALAADSLIQAPRRTSATVAALMLSLALIIGLGGIAETSYDSILDWVSTSLNPDLFVTTSENLSNRDFRFPAEMRAQLQEVEGIDTIQSVRTLRLPFRGGPVLLVAVELDAVQTTVAYRRTIRAGDAATMYRQAAQGMGVIVSENLAELHQLRLGDRIEVPAPTGLLRSPILGIVEDWSDQQGTIFVDRTVYRRHWQDDTANLFRVYVAKGARVADVRQRIIDRLAGTRRFFVLTNEDVRRYIIELTNQWLAMNYVQIGVAVLVAILGIVNTLTVSVIDRRRELGVLQAVGGLRNQVRHTIWMEAVAIGVIGLILGLALGAVNLHYMLEITNRDLAGMNVPYEFPFRIAAMLWPVILGAAFVAAIWPAESAVRGSLVEALEYE
jgi:putative ABC transport system permease protein